MRGVEGIVFDIQRFSIHDGPGIRSLVFLKGCPLKCLWCCNPESQSPWPEITYFHKNCIGCGRCLEVCTRGAISESSEGKIIDRMVCDLCGICVENCYAGALRIIGRSMMVDEVMKEVEKDIPFYRNSGGGVTLSGGEPLAQPDFALELFQFARERGIHTALETSGYARWEKLEAILDYTDYLLYDIKLMESERHGEYTGVENRLILKNARLSSMISSEKGIPMVIRIPLVPGHNDSPDQIASIARFARDLPSVEEVHLLPYHRLGESKYERIGKKSPLKGIKPPVEEEVERFRSLIRDFDLVVS